MHRPALGAALALLFAAQRPRRPVRWLIAGTLFGAWARIRVRNYPRRRWPQVLPQWFVVDVADVAVMAVASIRNGALLL